MAGEKYTNIGKARWENANVGVIKWDPENKAGLASVIDETTGTVYEIGGGEGDSDFSTATVTFQNSLGDGTRASYTASVICVLSDGIAIPDSAVERNGEVNLTLPLYKGKISIPLPSIFITDTVDTSIMPQFSGDIETSGMNLIITGDGTINAAGLPTSS